MGQKIVFYDADGTVINKNQMTDNVKETFEKLKENNVITVLSTGRSLPQITNSILNTLDLTHAITAAGGAVLLDNQIVSQDYLTGEHLKELVNYFDEYGLIYNLECNDSIYMKTGTKQKFLEALREKSEMT